MANRTLVVIPARGGSKGVPRKNLRPLAGKPLIFYAIQAALHSPLASRVVVSTDDEEIALFSRRFGAEVIMRPSSLAGDNITIDPVIEHALESAEARWREGFDVVVTVQPTAPLVRSKDIDAVIDKFADPTLETVVSAVDDRHLRWTQRDGEFVPEYDRRVNRQQLPPSYRETGALIACRTPVLRRLRTRIGSRVELFVMERAQSIDIDTYADFWLAEATLNKKQVAFTVIGQADTGLGHAYRALMLVHEFLHHDVVFLCSAADVLAQDYIARHNYPLVIHGTGSDDRLSALLSLKPDLVINDILDTTADYVTALQKEGIKVVNFEDLGLGAEVADLVVNALYPHQIPSEHILVGPRYFCLRDEFLHAPAPRPIDQVERVLVTFGGVDEGNLTERTLRVMVPVAAARSVHFDVVLGPGYEHRSSLDHFLRQMDYDHVSVAQGTSSISEYMSKADLAVTSGGRTVLELAALGVPTLVICQNARETTHKFASSENGIVNLGLRHELSDQRLLDAFTKILESASLRQTMRKKSTALNLTQGKTRVLARISSLFQNT